MSPAEQPDGPHRRNRDGKPAADAVIQRLAERQDGVVARRQLLAEGVPAHSIDYRVRTGRLVGLFRGVYRSGPVEGDRAPAFAAVLASGPEAVVSHRTAAVEWGVLPAGGGRQPLEVSIRRGFRKPGAGVRVHRSGGLRPADTTMLNGLPITTAARTVVDLAATSAPRTVERALAHAMRRGLVSTRQVAALMERHPCRAGSRALRSLLARDADPALVRSEAESRFLSLARKARLDRPETNVTVEGYEVDFLWPAQRLIVEVDGFAYHSSSRAFERDRSGTPSLPRLATGWYGSHGVSCPTSRRRFWCGSRRRWCGRIASDMEGPGRGGPEQRARDMEGPETWRSRSDGTGGAHNMSTHDPWWVCAVYEGEQSRPILQTWTARLVVTDR